MPDRAWGSAKVKILRLVLLGLAALAVVLSGMVFWQRLTRPGQAAHPGRAGILTGAGQSYEPAAQVEAARRIFENMLKGAPEYALFFDRLKAVFPGEYQSFLLALAKRWASSGEIGSPDLHLAEAVRALRLSRGILAAKAGTAALQHIFELQLAMLRALGAKNPRLCADYLSGGESPGYLEFAGQNRELVAELSLAGIDAIVDGEKEQVTRDPPTVAEFDSLEQLLRARGLRNAEIEALLDGTMGDPAVSDESLCKAGQIYLEALAAMPEESRLRIYGLAIELMARS
ncbi:MAG: hypothetical protein J2P49_09405 [Methylocapsa sp.]|nr:hypothetical protein [Methylocapsa sp.]